MIPARMPDSLHIVAGLRQLDEAGYVRVFQTRKLSPRGINTLLDLSEALAAPEQIRASLTRLDWPTLRGIRVGDAAALKRVAAHQFTRPDTNPPVLLDSVAEPLAQLLPNVPDFTEFVAADARNGSEAARLIATTAADAIEQLDLAPRTVRRGRGGIRMSGVEVRRIAADLDLDPDLAGSLYRWLFVGGLIAPLDDIWLPTATGRDFAGLPVITRWQTLAAAWMRGLTSSALAELCLVAAIPDPCVPFNDYVDATPTTSAIQLPGDLAARARSAAALGLIHIDPAVDLEAPLDGVAQLTRAGALLLNDDIAAAAQTLAAEFPAEVDRVYLQPDRSVIAPGPLKPDVEVQLRQVADLTHRAIASEYRITEQSLTRALQAGMTANQILALLKNISLTGVPQPVAYLIGDLAERYGQVRVRDHGGGTIVRALTDELADQLLVDASLRPLRLQPGSVGLTSAVSAPAVLTTLRESRYPAILENPDGSPAESAGQLTAEPFVAEVPPSIQSTAETLAELAARSRENDDQESWLRRRLELARRDRQALDVTIDLGGGKSRTLLLMPISVTPQRLRALDVDADVERTLPLRAITELSDE